MRRWTRRCLSCIGSPDVRPSGRPNREATGASPRDQSATAIRRGGSWPDHCFPKLDWLCAAASTPAAAESTWSHRGCGFGGSPSTLVRASKSSWPGRLPVGHPAFVFTAARFATAETSCPHHPAPRRPLFRIALAYRAAECAEHNCARRPRKTRPRASRYGRVNDFSQRPHEVVSTPSREAGGPR